MGKVPEEPLQPLASSSKPKWRPLTEEDIQRIKKLLVAFMIHRKRDNSPTDYNDWDQLRPVLKEGFDNALKGTTASTSSLNQAQRKWQELCESLVASGVTSWSSLMSGIKKALSQIKYNYENPVEDLLSEGHIRQSIFKHLDVQELQKLLKSKNIDSLSNDDKLELLSQINDPTSKINEEIHEWIRDGEDCVLATKLLSMQADILDKSGNVTGVKKLDVNLINREYGTFLESALQGNSIYDNYATKRYILAKYLIDSGADASIPMILDNNRYIKHNAFSFALFFSTKFDGMWDIVKYILLNRPISDFYHPKIETPHTFGKYMIFLEVYKIDLTWIILNFPRDKINWLITHGKLDAQVMIEDYEMAFDEIKKVYEPLEADLNRDRQQQVELKARYESVLNTLIEKLKTIEPYQKRYTDLQEKLPMVSALRDTHNVRGGKHKHAKSRK